MREAIVHGGNDRVRLTFGGYRREGSLIVPATVASRSKAGSSRGRLRAVAVAADVAPAAFARPPAPADAFLRGVSAVPMRVRWFGPQVTVTIDGGPPLHMLVDTGASYALTPRAASRCGLHPMGRGHVAGIGPQWLTERFVTARRVRIGAAQLRDQPFEVFEMPDLAPEGLDGSIGYEVFARFAARFDFVHGRLELAREAASLAPRGAPIPIRLYGGQPEARGALDGIRGPIAIDTGSTYGLDVMSPVVRAHRLLARYAAREREHSYGVGGALTAYAARAKAVSIGGAVVRDAPLSLDVVADGAMADPHLVGNAGLRILSHFVMVLDYRGRRMYLDPIR